MGPHPPSHARSTEPCRSDRLVVGVAGRFVRTREKGGDATGPNYTDRGKPGTKRHVVVDRAGLPLAVTLTGANRHDSMALTATVDAIHPVRQRRGRPRKRPAKLHADKGYDFKRCRADLRARGDHASVLNRSGFFGGSNF